MRSGYLGQFLLTGLSQSFQITYTYGKNRLQTAAEGTANAAQVRSGFCVMEGDMRLQGRPDNSDYVAYCCSCADAVRGCAC